MNCFEYGNPGAPFRLIQMADDSDFAGMENETAEIRRLTDVDFQLVAVGTQNWNDDLSPWQAPAAFGKDVFGGGAERTLEAIGGLCADNRVCIIGGYSLAGLFALWASCRTDRFAAVAAASPSVWFPGFSDYLKANPTKSGAVYLSLGDREEKTRNPVLSTVGDRIREAEALFRQQGVTCTLEWNSGNHFRDADLRTAKAFAWALQNCRSAEEADPSRRFEKI